MHLGEFSSGGRFENSPAVHCRVQVRHPTRPEGTDESIECCASVQLPIFVAGTRPSLRDSILLFDKPILERVGYSQISLRETAVEQPLLFELRMAEELPNSNPRPHGRRYADEKPIRKLGESTLSTSGTSMKPLLLALVEKLEFLFERVE